MYIVQIVIAFLCLAGDDAAVFLIENGADPNIGEFNLNTALLNAVHKRKHSFELLKIFGQKF